MIEQEGRPEALLKNVKTLRLVHQRYVLDGAEGLVFVSPQQDGSQRCGECGQIYKPLVYPVGTPTEAHHFHSEEGGIYYFPEYNVNSPVALNWTGWIALLDPLGELDDLGRRLARAQRVTIREIKAYCTEAYCLRSLNQGVVITKTEDLNNLLPICDINEHPQFAQNTRYGFIVTEDGNVLFSQLEPIDTSSNC